MGLDKGEKIRATLPVDDNGALLFAWPKTTTAMKSASVETRLKRTQASVPQRQARRDPFHPRQSRKHQIICIYLFSFSRVVIQYPGELPVRQDTPSGFTGNSMVRSHKRRMGYIRPVPF